MICRLNWLLQVPMSQHFQMLAIVPIQLILVLYNLFRSFQGNLFFPENALGTSHNYTTFLAKFLYLFPTVALILKIRSVHTEQSMVIVVDMIARNSVDTKSNPAGDMI